MTDSRACDYTVSGKACAVQQMWDEGGAITHLKGLLRSSGAIHTGLGRLLPAMRPLAPRVRRPSRVGKPLCKTGSALSRLRQVPSVSLYASKTAVLTPPWLPLQAMTTIENVRAARSTSVSGGWAGSCPH